MSAFEMAPVDGIAVVMFDLPGEPINKISATVKAEFVELLESIRHDSSLRGVAFLSGKRDTFIAGADIEEFVALKSQEEATRLSGEGQDLVGRVAAFPKPIVVGIHGACLGGGLELALGAHYRVATDHPKTQLGLPEVQLGILPGASGTQRLPRLVAGLSNVGPLYT